MGGLILPIVLPGPIEKWGTERTMRGLSVAVIVILGPILPLIRGRLPEDRIGRRATKPDQERSRSWLRSPTFWSLMAMNTVQGLAYYLPSIWLPSKRLASN
jgi:MFS transporter, MCT family, solute carrier family 16 (monocarboxylic acid transporters), member 10